MDWKAEVKKWRGVERKARQVGNVELALAAYAARVFADTLGNMRVTLEDEVEYEMSCFRGSITDDAPVLDRGQEE